MSEQFRSSKQVFDAVLIPTKDDTISNVQEMGVIGQARFCYADARQVLQQSRTQHSTAAGPLSQQERCEYLH
jgi:hypothetical protein